MAAQAFTTPHRHAIWAAYGYKCFYCREPLGWDGVQVDHVVPEYLAKEPQDRARVFRDLGLPDDWSLTADQNLVAACDQCNARKRDRIPEPKQVMLWLTEARDKAPLIAVLRERYERRFRGDILRAKLETAIAAGYLESGEVHDLLSAALSVTDRPFRLATGIELLDGTQIDDLRASEVELLLDLPVKLGADLSEGLLMEREDSVTLNVRTCREYQHAIAKGYYTSTTFAIKMESLFMRTLGVLEAVRACRPAARSYIRDPRLGICDLDHLPSAILPLFGEITAEVRQQLSTHPTVASLVTAGCAKVL